MASNQLSHSTSMFKLGTKLLPGVFNEACRGPIVEPHRKTGVVGWVITEGDPATDVVPCSAPCPPFRPAGIGICVSILCHALALLLLATTWNYFLPPSTVVLNAETPTMLVSLAHIDLHSDTETNIGGGGASSPLTVVSEDLAPLAAPVPSVERVEQAKPQSKVVPPVAKKVSKFGKNRTQQKLSDPKLGAASVKEHPPERPLDPLGASDIATTSIGDRQTSNGEGLGDATAAIAAVAGARVQSAGSLGPGVGPTVANYQAVLGSWLTRFKFYPRRARTMAIEGMVAVHIVIKRDGSVVSREVISSSGSSVLDDAAIEMVRLADPFPKAPTNIAGDQIEFTVPIKFYLS